MTRFFSDLLETYGWKLLVTGCINEQFDCKCFCDECCKFLITKKERGKQFENHYYGNGINLKDWWNQLTMESNPAKKRKIDENGNYTNIETQKLNSDESFDKIVGYLLLNFKMHDGIIEKDEALKMALKKLDQAGTYENIKSIADSRTRRILKTRKVILQSGFGTGKTVLLKSRAEELRQMSKSKKYPIFLILGHCPHDGFKNFKTLLYLQLKHELNDIQVLNYEDLMMKVHGEKPSETPPILDLIEIFVKNQIKNNSKSCFFLDEFSLPVKDTRKCVEKINGLASLITEHFWLVIKNGDLFETNQFFDEKFSTPELNYPLRSSKNIVIDGQKFSGEDDSENEKFEKSLPVNLQSTFSTKKIYPDNDDEIIDAFYKAKNHVYRSDKQKPVVVILPPKFFNAKSTIGKITKLFQNDGIRVLKYVSCNPVTDEIKSFVNNPQGLLITDFLVAQGSEWNTVICMLDDPSSKPNFSQDMINRARIELTLIFPPTS